MRWGLCMVLLMAGCLDQAPDAEVPVDQGDGAVEQAASRWYLHGDGTLSPEPASGLFQITWNNEDHFLENPPHQWVADHGTHLVRNATAHITYTSDVPLVASQYRSGELTVWSGAGDYVGSHAFAFTERVFEGTVSTAMPLEIPPAGLVIAPDWPLHLQVGSYLVDPADRLHIDLAKSYLEIESTPTPALPWQVEPVDRQEGALGDCTDGTGQRVAHTFDPGNATHVEVRMTSDGPGHPDLDLFITADGERVMRAHGSTGDETLRIYPQNMLPGPWTLAVVSLCAGERTYTLEFLAGR